MEANTHFSPPHSSRMAARIFAEDGLSAVVPEVKLHRHLSRIQIAADSNDRVRNYGSETAFGPTFNTIISM